MFTSLLKETAFKNLFKTNKNRCKQYKTPAIVFSIEPLSQTGYWLAVCHGQWHLHGLTRDARTGKQAELQKEKILPTSGFDPTTFGLGSRHLILYTTRSVTKKWLKLNGFYLYF